MQTRRRTVPCWRESSGVWTQWTPSTAWTVRPKAPLHQRRCDAHTKGVLVMYSAAAPVKSFEVARSSFLHHNSASCFVEILPTVF